MSFDVRQLADDYLRCGNSSNCGLLDPVMLMGQSAFEREMFFQFRGLSAQDSATIGSYGDYSAGIDNAAIQQITYNGFMAGGGTFEQMDQAITSLGGF